MIIHFKAFTNALLTILLEEYYGYGEYSFISFKKRDATIGVYRTQYNNNSSEYYTYIRMSWPEQ